MQSTQELDPYCEDPWLQFIQANNTRRCRICWQDYGELIRPCKCSGTQAFVHQSCLENQIETARIMRVANVDGFYNSRCPLCKFHIQFKIQEYKCSMNTQDVKQAIKTLDQDSAASLSLNLSIVVVLLGILIVIVSGHIRSAHFSSRGYNCKLFFLQLLIFIVECFLTKALLQRFPRKIRRLVLITPQQAKNSVI